MPVSWKMGPTSQLRKLFTMSKYRVIQVRVDDRLYNIIRRDALKKDLPISTLVRDILVTWYMMHDVIIKDLKKELIEK